MNRVGRREFARRAAGGAAGLALARLGVAAEAAGKAASSKVGGLQIGVQSFTFRKFTLERMLDAMRAIGLDSVELWTGHLDPAKADEAAFKAARGKLDAAGIRVSAYCVNFAPDVTDALLDRAFTGAGLLGTKIMTTSTEKAVVPKLDTWAQKYGVTLGLHNHWLKDSWFHGNEQQNFGGPADFEEGLLGRSKHIAINLDAGHFSAAGHDPVAFFEKHHDRIVSLHVKDRAADAQHSYTRFGQGATPIAALLKACQKVHFKYAVNIEWEIDEDNPTEPVREAYAYVKKALREA